MMIFTVKGLAVVYGNGGDGIKVLVTWGGCHGLVGGLEQLVDVGCERQPMGCDYGSLFGSVGVCRKRRWYFRNSSSYSRPFRWRSPGNTDAGTKICPTGVCGAVEVDIVGGEIKISLAKSSWIIAVGRERKGALVIALWWDNGMGDNEMVVVGDGGGWVQWEFGAGGPWNWVDMGVKVLVVVTLALTAIVVGWSWQFGATGGCGCSQAKWGLNHGDGNELMLAG
ncbi:hypothetical protein Acr_14g0001700 [Actinidia rufa]|uniref:Uncharacterized protein n=1 Tax=Actinidia rufa TaxID=165716 RepID=A0A7J0FPA7_9ERIC|nr:hypothetical protein Acr_14g0001700 [Actinidia rufa]